MEAASERLGAEVRAHPELYSGMWSALITGQATDSASERALVVGTVGDLADVRPMLEEAYPFNLCVVSAAYSKAELDGAANQISALDQSWRVDVEPALDRVVVHLAVVDGQAARLLEPYQDRITLDPLVTAAN